MTRQVIPLRKALQFRNDMDKYFDRPSATSRPALGEALSSPIGDLNVSTATLEEAPSSSSGSIRLTNSQNYPSGSGSRQRPSRNGRNCSSSENCKSFDSRATSY
ncbi:unnamed protein product [Dicrocoelium dendriticum]|nr:unnamed protein product [Dicrocoelium dendriticum]